MEIKKKNAKHPPLKNNKWHKSSRQLTIPLHYSSEFCANKKLN